jgi:competence protein ComEA
MKIIKKYGILIGIVVTVIMFIIISLGKGKDNDIIFTGQPIDSGIINEPYIYVDIKGEVKNPGVYKLEKGSRVFQLVNSAGGYKESADKNALNLSKVLRDEEVVYIPNVNEQFPIYEEYSESSTLKININNAPKELLDTLPGIGPSTAQAIVDYIEENSYFDAIEDIMNVSGIGESTFDKIKNLITVD